MGPIKVEATQEKEVDMVHMIVMGDMAMIIMVMTIEVDMDIAMGSVVVDMQGMRLRMVQNKDLKLIMIKNLDQNILSKVILKSQLVMDQKLALMVIMIMIMVQSQKILRINSGHIELLNYFVLCYALKSV